MCASATLSMGAPRRMTSDICSEEGELAFCKGVGLAIVCVYACYGFSSHSSHYGCLK